MEQLLALHGEGPARSWWDRFLGTSPLTDETRSWYQGAVGEIAVGRTLARLGPEWTALHSVPVGAGASDIDHVLIGPGGVFTLNTKNHSGQSVWVAGRTLMVSGQKQLHIPKAFHEAARAQDLLTAAVGEAVPVTGVLVLVGPDNLAVKEKPAGVTVITERKLLRWLRRRPPVLTSDQVSRIAAVAAQPATWHADPPAREDPVALHGRFGALHARVRAARRRRRAWTRVRRSVHVAARLAYACLLIYAGVFLLDFFLDGLRL
jgi:hypothetical protein